MTKDDIAWKRLDLMCDGSDLAVFSKPVALRAWPGEMGRERSSSSSISLPSMRRKVDLNAYRCAPPVSDYAFADGSGAGEEERHSSYGVFPLASLFNHSCAPNMCKVLLADWVFLRAARDIEPCEELTQFYCDIRMPVEMRQKELSDLFGFSCTCPRCRFELQLESPSRDASLDASLELWRRFYSCEVPLVHQRFASELQGLVEAAENAVRARLETMDASATSPSGCWALWPLVPALQQLAARLRLDGRLEESLEVFRRADAVVRSVVPLSNIHLRLHSEMLQTCRSDAALAENLWLVAAGFGAGLQVWQTLVGFRLPRLASRAASLPAPVVPGQCSVHFRWEESQGSRSLLIWSAAFRSSSEICLDASKDVLILNARNAEELKVSCSNVDVATMETKFSRKRRCLTVIF